MEEAGDEKENINDQGVGVRSGNLSCVVDIRVLSRSPRNRLRRDQGDAGKSRSVG
jgi:hypothetical protein